MMTLAQFKARTSGGIKPNRSNHFIQQIDALLALYEAMDATMTLEERKALADKIVAASDHFLDKKRVIAMRMVLSFVNNDPGHRVPFYFLPYIGGSESLRGFKEFRFRDENMVFFNAEYRGEAFSGLDMALFYDAGKTTPERSQLDFTDMNTSYGIGVRFHSPLATVFRFEVAKTRHEGIGLIFAFGPSF